MKSLSVGSLLLLKRKLKANDKQAIIITSTRRSDPGLVYNQAVAIRIVSKASGIDKIVAESVFVRININIPVSVKSHRQAPVTIYTAFSSDLSSV